MIAISEDGWILIREETVPAEYTTGDPPPGTVIVINSTSSRDGYTTAEKAAEIIAKAVQEIEKEVLQAHIEAAENAVEWPIDRARPIAGIGSRKSPNAKARGPPAREERSLNTIPCFPCNGGRLNAGPAKA